MKGAGKNYSRPSLPLNRTYLSHFAECYGGDHYICLKTNCDKVTSAADD